MYKKSILLLFRMRECGGDLLVDTSEVLFNELVFFRLMKDMDNPLIAEKMQKTQVWSDFEASIFLTGLSFLSF